MLAYHKGGLVTIIEENTKLSLLLLILMFISILVAFIIFIFFSIRAAKREMYLCAAFVKQMNATQQAERKSMFKTRTYLRANHDIRSSLAAISTLLDLCHADAHPHPELAANLVQIKSCNKDLLGEFDIRFLHLCNIKLLLFIIFINAYFDKIIQIY